MNQDVKDIYTHPNPPIPLLNIGDLYTIGISLEYYRVILKTESGNYQPGQIIFSPVAFSDAYGIKHDECIVILRAKENNVCMITSLLLDEGKTCVYSKYKWYIALTDEGEIVVYDESLTPL